MHNSFLDENFLKLCKEYKQIDITHFNKAAQFANTHLKDKKRLMGDSYYDRNIRVAKILLENTAEPQIILVSLLIGIKEFEEIKKEFGIKISNLLEEFIQLKEIKSKNEQLEAQALRKIILTTLKDVGVFLVKLATKLDNLRSLEVFEIKEQNRICEEVLEIYAPLAYRLGLEKLKIQLEDLAFKVINPKKYDQIVKYLEHSKEEREDKVNKAIKKIKDLCKYKVEIEKIKGRPKHIYSIYKKIVKRKVKLDKQYDHLGIRIITNDEKDCYTILGILHENFDPIDGRLKDYIANPKPNLYRSIHTGLNLHNKRLEVQIRTIQMDEFAEEGLAAHWRYKGVKSDQNFERRMAWLKGVLDLKKDKKDILETLNVDVFGDKIYCYTPKGDSKELPKEATILDFAYMVHEHIGNKTVGARVNGKFVPIRHKLKSNDVIEIITNKNQRPRRTWLKLVNSSRARQKIRKSLKEHEKLAPIHFRKFKPQVSDEIGVLVESSDFEKATCILAKCCSAIPGDKIIGILTKKKIISTHKIDCRLALKEENRWVHVNWKETFNQKIKFRVIASERSGLLADLLNTIARAGFDVKEAKAKPQGMDAVECSFLVIPRDIEEVKQMILRINKVKGVQRIYFS
jgi:GTP pyrophosphokinase